MKKLKLIAIFTFAMLAFNSMSAQTNTNTTKKETINSSDKQPEKIVFKNIDYYIIDGVWYAKIKKRFVLRTAPKGAKLKKLPKGGDNVVMAGVKYYRLNNVFYKKSKGGGYEVARP